MTYDLGHLFIYLLNIHVSLVKYLFISFVHFFDQVVCKRFLHILDISILINKWFASTSFHGVACNFIFFMVSFELLNFWILMIPNLSIFLIFMNCAFGFTSEGSLPNLRSQKIFSYISSFLKCYWYSLTYRSRIYFEFIFCVYVQLS